MENSKTFKISWHYTVIIIPLILCCATIGSYHVLSGTYIHKVHDFRIYAVIPATLYFWYLYMTVPYKIQVSEDNKNVTVLSLLKKTNISTKEIEKITKNSFTFKVNYTDGVLRITTFMDNSQELFSILSSGKTDIKIDSGYP